MGHLRYQLKYHPLVAKQDVPKLGKPERTRIQATIWQKLTTEPATFGKPLQKSLQGHRSLRVGDYRVIFRIAENVVIILAIEHRSVAYKNFEKRLKNIF